MKYHFLMEKEELGFSAEGIELKGCFTQADSMQELVENCKEAAEALLMDSDPKTAYKPADPKIEGENIIQIKVDSKLALANYIKYLRLKNKKTQPQVAFEMGYVNVYGYQKIEYGKSAINLNTVDKIKKVFPDLDFNLVVD